MTNRFGWSPLHIGTIATLLCLGAALRLANLSNVGERSLDEEAYTFQAQILLHKGNAGVKSLVAGFQRNPVARLFPAPTRLGYLWPLATTMRLTGKRDESVGAYLSCAASIGTLFLLALTGVRFFPFWATLFALLFFVVSPMELAISRRTWADALIEFLGLSLVYVSAEITRDSARRVWYFLFAILGSLGIAVKESGVIGYAFCAIWVLWILLIERKEWVNAAVLVAGGLAGLTIIIAWLAVSVGGLSVLAQIVTGIPSSNAVNQYAIENQSGPGYLLLRALEVMSPVTAVLTLVGLGVAMFSPTTQSLSHFPAAAANRQAIRWITFFTLAYLAWPMLLPHWLNLRYITVIFGPFYLIAGLGFASVVSLLLDRLKLTSRKIVAGLAIAALTIGAGADYYRFKRFFVRDGLTDLSIKLLLDANRSS